MAIEGKKSRITFGSLEMALDPVEIGKLDEIVRKTELPDYGEITGTMTVKFDEPPPIPEKMQDLIITLNALSKRQQKRQKRALRRLLQRPNKTRCKRSRRAAKRPAIESYQLHNPRLIGYNTDNVSGVVSGKLQYETKTKL